ncbi:MAG: CPBP family intramembrane glutamic endopeptidase [Bacteroidota bacterium]|nr:CPBP family intramembrane glutamic endopeptidase [Bacteroidota bacterium]
MEKLKTILVIGLILVYTSIILVVPKYIKQSPFFSYHPNSYINFQINYQLILLAITALSLTTTYFLSKANFMNYFSIGNISAPAQELKLFGIKQNDSWIKTGVSLSIIISIVTGLFMFFQIKGVGVDWSHLLAGILWIVLFSLTNSFGEEIIYRLGIVSPLSGLMSPIIVYVISAILFGVPHLAGMPSGLIGATMAGLLGLVLAKSLFETNGLFWAWLIHFLQDVIIIGSLYLMSFKK